MAVIRRSAAVIAAVVPVIAGLVGGRAPGGWRTAGMAVALVAILLVSRSGPVGRPDRESVLVAVGSGSASACSSCVHRRGEASASGRSWPSAGSASCTGRGLAVQPARGHSPAGWASLAAGVLDVTANVTFLLATQQGLLTIVAVIAAALSGGDRAAGHRRHP